MVSRRLDALVLCEFLAFWLGGTTRKELAALLGYGDSLRQITNLLQGPHETTEYDPKRKRWIAAASTAKLRGPRSSHDVTAVLRGFNAWSAGTKNSPLSPVVDTARFRRPVSPDIFKALMAACVRRYVVDIVYRSAKREIAVAFSPHTLVTAPHRDHFRGYSIFEDGGEGHFWDLVPSRVLQIQSRFDLAYVDITHDADWFTQKQLSLTMRPDLPEELRQAIRLEHNLDSSDGLDIGSVPLALLPYVRA